MPDEGHMAAQVFIRGRVRHAEDLAQTADAVSLEHLDVHAFGDTVFDPVFADIEPVIGEAAVFDPPVMILNIPFFGDAEAVRQQINGADDPPEEAPPARKPNTMREVRARSGGVAMMVVWTIYTRLTSRLGSSW